MPLPDSLRSFNRDIGNRVLGPLSRVMRPFATVTHTGRLTGRTYDTVVLAFEREGTVAVALTYGRDVDWLKNVLAAGGGGFVLGGDKLDVTNPRLVGEDDGAGFMPGPVRRALRLLDVHDYLLADRV